jgi:hypothetical protein
MTSDLKTHQNFKEEMPFAFWEWCVSKSKTEEEYQKNVVDRSMFYTFVRSELTNKQAETISIHDMIFWCIAQVKGKNGQ